MRKNKENKEVKEKEEKEEKEIKKIKRGVILKDNNMCRVLILIIEKINNR